MKIKFLPYQPHCFAFGGFELQMLGALEAVQKQGGNAGKLDPWDRSDAFDILHCWGLGLPHDENIRWARRSGKKVVITGLLSYNEFLLEKIRHLVSSYIRRNYFLIEMAKSADAFTVLNDVQAEICHKYYKVPHNKIHIIPNIVSSNFHKASVSRDFDAVFLKNYGITNYIFTTGNVCERKNQLNLIKACIKENLKLVIVGKPLAGEKQYIQEVNSLVESNENILWIKGLPENSPELISAYMNCSVFALPSYVENQPISLLEAVIIGKPLLIADRAYAKQSYYTKACLVNPKSTNEIAAGLRKILSNPMEYTTPKSFVEECNEQSIGNRYIDMYQKITA